MDVCVRVHVSVDCVFTCIYIYVYTAIFCNICLNVTIVSSNCFLSVFLITCVCTHNNTSVRFPVRVILEINLILKVRAHPPGVTLRAIGRIYVLACQEERNNAEFCLISESNIHKSQTLHPIEEKLNSCRNLQMSKYFNI